MKPHLESMGFDELMGYAKGLEYAFECTGRTISANRELPTVSVVETPWGTVRLSAKANEYLKNMPAFGLDRIIAKANKLAEQAIADGKEIPEMDWP